MNDDHRKRAEELFQAAVDLPPAQRAALLAQRCQGDATLQADVEKLLGNYERAMGEFTQSPPVQALGLGDDEPPAQIGSYRLLRKLGEGGFGEVHLARQSEPVRRQVALKILKLGMDSKQVVARFEAERQALALMEHPHIAKVFDAGTCERGRPYFVMEYVTGLPITAFCDDQRLDTEQRLRLFIQVCEAVQHAHQKGMIHRDIKPSNIMVELIDGQPVPKVIDFGIAKALGPSLTQHTLFTEQGQLMGTPEYMSPEQAQMSGLNVDTRTDIYSLGVILYELLTGVLPFDPTTLRSKGVGDIQRIIREEEPAKPSARLSGLPSGPEAQARQQTEPRPSGSGPAEPRPKGRGSVPCATTSVVEVARRHRTDPSTLRKLIRGDLDWITMRAMEKDRARRYATASELAADIRRHLKHEPVLAGPPGASYRLAKFVRRNKTAVVSAVTVALALVAGIIGTSWQAVRATRAEADARALAESERQQKEAVNVHAAMYRANYEFLLWGLGFRGAADANAEDVTVRQMLNSASGCIAERFAGRPAREASVRHTVGAIYFVAGDYERAIIHCRRAYKLQKDLPGTSRFDLMTILGNLGGSLHEAERSEEEAQCWAQDAEHAAQFFQENYPLLGEAADEMRRSLIGRDQPSDDEVLAHLNAIMDAYAAAMPPESPGSLALTHLLLGVGAYLDAKFGVSEQRRPLVEKVFELARRTLGEDSSVTVMLSLEVGRYPARPGEEKQRVTQARELLNIVRANMPSYHYLGAACEGALGQALVQLGRPEDREEVVQHLVHAYRGIRDRRGPEFYRTKIALGRLAGRSGIGTLMSREQQRYLQHPAVREALREGIEQEADSAALNSIAWAMIRYPGLDPAHYDLALQAARRANEVAPDDAVTARTLGVAQYRAGRYEEALPTLARADALSVEAGLGEQPDNWAFMAMAHHRLGHADEARATLQRLRKLMEDPDQAGNVEKEDFVREAEELIEADAGDPG